MRVVLLLAILAFLPLAAHAAHCTSYSTARPEVDATLVAPYYVDNDFSQTDGPLFSLWVYEETNGIPGLQRGDEVVDNTCHGSIEPDTIIF